MQKSRQSILTVPDYMISVYLKLDFFHKGPLSWFEAESKDFNPRGRYAIDIAALTGKQKAIVIDLVGKAIPKLIARVKRVDLKYLILFHKTT
jgi:hypothetical protein